MPMYATQQFKVLTWVQLIWILSIVLMLTQWTVDLIYQYYIYTGMVKRSFQLHHLWIRSSDASQTDPQRNTGIFKTRHKSKLKGISLKPIHNFGQMIYHRLEEIYILYFSLLRQVFCFLHHIRFIVSGEG